MKVILRRAVAQVIGYKAFAPYGVSEESWKSWRNEYDIDLGRLSTAQLDDLEDLLTRRKNVRGTGPLLRDLQAWKAVLKDGAATLKARSVRQFEPLLAQYLKPVPGHRLYLRHDEGAMLCYYVTHVQYHPPVERSDYRTPAYVSMHLVFEEIGGKKELTISFSAEDVRGIPVAVALADKGFQPETPELRKEYLQVITRFLRVAGQVGKQYWAQGPSKEMSSRHHWGRLPIVPLGAEDGSKGRVVIDVFREEGEDQERDRGVSLNRNFWKNIKRVGTYNESKDVDEGDDDEDEDEGDVDLEGEEIEIPIHPWVVVFHLAKHLRLRAHVEQLEEYVYDEGLADKLILPHDQKELVKLLIETKGGMFKDIVRGKGGGAVILLTGAPGTGKTLTAEVYAESEKRALYSVQCSQLGTSADALEAALLQVFVRAKRWNAVILLDEADVYVHQRGNSMSQNAIVGVFLRVLEYQGTVMFLTTNRGEDVDDAVASRCIARLTYTAPGPEDARAIWRVLADVSDVSIPDDVIASVVKKNAGMTGRDIKNILKLASLLQTNGTGITEEQVAYVQQFKPTGQVGVV